MLYAYWQIGKYIVEFEQKGNLKAEYGKHLLERLAKDLGLRYGKGFGRSNLEAVMHDKPLVCSDIKVFHELVGDYAIYCNPFDKNSIKKAIKKSFNQNNDRMFKLEASRFDFERNKGAFIRTIEEVLNEQ